MEGEADRDELRFSLAWPEGDLGKPDDELTDFSFEWDEQLEDAPVVAAGEPQFSDPIDPLAGGMDMAFLDTGGALNTVRRALDDNNAALRQLSEAVYELASNVRLLVDEVESMGRGGAVGAGVQAGDITASAMVTMSTEMTAAIERLGDDLKVTKSDLRALMDDVVAAAGGQGPGGTSAPRVAVELDRVHVELQALKRRLPVRARELEVDDIVDRVTEAVLAALDLGAPKPAAVRRRAKAAPRKAAAPKADRAADRRQRPLRAD